jgi:hypothetical protein
MLPRCSMDENECERKSSLDIHEWQILGYEDWRKMRWKVDG